MKLKKIVSLALAGVLAVSMLAGCKDGESSSSSEGTVVTPVDTSFAASVNAELSPAEKAVITFGSDSTLASVLDKVANELKTSYIDDTAIGFVIGNYDDSKDFRHLLGLAADESFTNYANGNYDANIAANRNDWTYFNISETGTQTVADLIVVPGNLTDEGVAEQVASYVGQLIVNGRMPNDNKAAATATGYKYDYTGDIAVVKVTSLSGDYSAYVVGLSVTQTATKVSNVSSGN